MDVLNSAECTVSIQSVLAGDLLQPAVYLLLQISLF